MNHLIFLEKSNPQILAGKKYYLLKEDICGMIFNDGNLMGAFNAASGSVLKECGAEKQSTNKYVSTFSLFYHQNFIIETTRDQVLEIGDEKVFLVTLAKPMERFGAIFNREQLDLALSADIGDDVQINGQGCRIVGIGPSEGKAGHYFHAEYRVWIFLY